MRRLVTLVAVILAAGLSACGVAAQQVSGLPRVGLLFLGTESASRGSAEFREGMQSLGWTEGSNFSIEHRFANRDPARLSADAVDLVAAKVSVIVAFGPLASQAARHATSIAQLMAELERAAARIGVPVVPVVVGTAQDLPRCFNEITAHGPS
jgi:hypothetical protein